MRNGWFKIAAIVGLIVFVGMGTAMAGNWSTAGANNKTVLTGGHQSNFTATTAAGNATFTTVAGESLAINDTLTITLTGGATFAGGLTLIGTHPTGASNVIDLGAGVSVAAPPLSGGTSGTTTATWRLLSTATTNSAFTLNAASANIFNVTAVGPTGTVDLLMNLKTSTGTQIGTADTTFSGSGGGDFLFKGNYALTVADTAQTDTADVRAAVPYTKFLNNVVNGTATVLTVTTKSTVAAAGSVPNSQFDVKKILVSLVGDFNGVTKVTGTNLTGSSSTGDTTGGTAGQFLINADKTAAYGVNTAALASGAAGLAIAPTFTIDGTTTQAARNFTAKVEGLEQGTAWLAYSYFGHKTHYTIARNGVSFTANSLGGYNTVKISDKSGGQPALGGKVNVVAWDVNGVKLADAAGVTSIMLKSNETITLTGDVLAARFVGTAMKYEVSIESTGAIITNVKKTPEGFGSTTYTNANGAL